MPRKILLVVAAAATSCAVIVALVVTFLVGGGAATSTTAPTLPAGSSVGGGDLRPDVIGVVALRPDTVLLVHEASDGATRFDQGVLWVDVAVEQSLFRWIEGADVVDGGRTAARPDLLAGLPVGLHVVVSYDVDNAPASIYGILGSPIATSSTTISYPITVYDAPGNGSTYTLSGSYDIPATLASVRVFISGQAVDTQP